jgi:alpha/beta superfamily hydrolase
VPGERVTVKSAEGFDVPMIFYSPGGDSGTAVPTKRRSSKNNNSTCKAPTPRRPTILAGSGYDGAQEDLYHGLARYANDRGWNLVTYEGPGQPTVRRRQGLGFRPDWWSVVTPAVDYLLSRDDVDASRLALLGQSFGGTLAPLAASRERRFAAVLAVDGLYSMQDMVRANLPAELMAVFDAGEKEVFDQVLDSVRKNETADTTFRWLVDQSLWSFDTDSPFEWFTRLGEFTLDGVIGNISCPVFVGSGEDDLSTAGQPEKVAALLGDKGHYHLFKTDLGAGEHCQIGAEAQLALVAFDWLEGVFEGVGQTGKNSTAR